MGVLEEPIEGELGIEDEEMLEERTSYLPPFMMLLSPVKGLTMGHPGAELNGFKFSFGTDLSPNFTVMHEVNLAPKKPQAQTGNPLMDMYGEKTPFYSLNLQYHHGEITPRVQKLHFSLVGRVDSLGRLDAIFFKNFRDLRVKLHSQFMNSNVAYSGTQLELEHQGRHTKQTLHLTSQHLNYGFVERIGKRLLLGLECNYLLGKSSIATGFAARFARTPHEKFFAQYSGLANAYTFGSTFRFNDDTTVAVELELGSQGGQGPASTAGLGYRKRAKAYQVETSIHTNGEVKSFFTYNHQMFCKLRLFLAGNLMTEDFRTGYSLALGRSDD